LDGAAGNLLSTVNINTGTASLCVFGWLLPLLFTILI
jgi:hypothetical protein